MSFWRRGPPLDLVSRLRDPRDRLACLVLDDATGPACVIDSNFRLQRANAALGQLIANPALLLPGQDISQIFDPAFQPTAIEEIGLILTASAREARVFFAALANSQAEAGTPSDHAVRVAALPLWDGTQRPGAVLRLTDLSAQRQLEAQLAHSQKLQATGQLAGGIAHDFNNLLTAILGAADGILAREPPGESHDDAAQIHDSAQRGAALVRQLLAFGRQQRLAPQVIEVNNAIVSVSTLLRRLLGGRIRLTLALEEPSRRIRADPTQLDQVLINLAVNARDAMPKGGELVLRSGHITVYRPLLHGVETIPPGRYVMIEVQDTGCGIAPDILPQIFDPFFTTRRDRGGSGLGLSTVHGIVRQSGGFLAVDTEPGRGTNMRLYLPRCDEETTPAIIAPAISANTAARSGHILLVDDEDPVRRLASRALRRAGWEVVEAISGDEAVELTDLKRPPTALITDLVMPGIDGEALGQAIRSLIQRPDLPIILVSGYAQTQANQESFEPNTVFLAKPYSLADLITTLDRLLTNGHATQS